MAPNPSSKTTLAVVLGAHEFPKTQLGANPAFAASATGFKDYLLNDFGLPKQNLLDLFDTQESPDGVDEKIATFLKNRISTAKIANPEQPVCDVVFYYVGHGSFTSDGGLDRSNEYFLTLRNTRAENTRVSGYLIQTLATTLKSSAKWMRKYLILDCCFSAAAYAYFQSAPLQVAVEKTLLEFPDRGITLLCAASKTDPAIAPPNYNYTMFSAALLQALKQGDENAAENITFQELYELIQTQINETFHGADSKSRPEILSPDKRQGDLARIPFFPNRAKRQKVAPKVSGERIELKTPKPSLVASELSPPSNDLTQKINEINELIKTAGELIKEASTLSSLRTDLRKWRTDTAIYVQKVFGTEKALEFNGIAARENAQGEQPRILSEAQRCRKYLVQLSESPHKV
jgi:hypothetical protein